MQANPKAQPKSRQGPPGRIKIMASFSQLMQEKDFHSITTARIAQNAQVTEGLIYKYFKDKKDLLYQVLADHFEEFLANVDRRIATEKTCVAKLSVIIQSSLESYSQNRLFSKILLLEVRNSPGYFESHAYAMVKTYAATILEIIEQGIETGELRRDIEPVVLRKVILGSIEHACLGEVIFGRRLDAKKVSQDISQIIFKGVKHENG